MRIKNSLKVHATDIRQALHFILIVECKSENRNLFLVEFHNTIEGSHFVNADIIADDYFSKKYKFMISLS